MADSPLALVPAVLGAALLVAALDAADVGAAATPFEAMLFGCLGIAFAVVLRRAGAGRRAAALRRRHRHRAGARRRVGRPLALSTSKPGDALTLELPDWGTGLAAARLGRRRRRLPRRLRGLRAALGPAQRAAAVGMLLGLLAAVASEVLLDSELPTLALMAVGYLAPNVDRLRALFARPADG